MRTVGFAACVALCAVPSAEAQPHPAAIAECSDANLLAKRPPFAEQDLHGPGALLTDERVGRAGTRWDAPMAVTLEASGSITFDLGEPREIRAIYLQGDANDEYTVSGSLDPNPSGFGMLAVIANVAAGQGPALTTMDG